MLSPVRYAAGRNKRKTDAQSNIAVAIADAADEAGELTVSRHDLINAPTSGVCDDRF